MENANIGKTVVIVTVQKKLGETHSLLRHEDRRTFNSQPISSELTSSLD
jgi:hypothetical protein